MWTESSQINLFLYVVDIELALFTIDEREGKKSKVQMQSHNRYYNGNGTVLFFS